ncbi:unnamed protein product, partial [Ilex paraguariensis]
PSTNPPTQTHIVMELVHFSHEHPLFFKEVRNDKGQKVICRGCQNSIMDTAYSCGKCDYFLHKRCAELPRQVKDPIHSHQLALHEDSPYGLFTKYICNVCRKVGEYSFNYFCSPCKFNICMSCFMGDRTITHKSHEHPLVLLSRPAFFYCNI